MTKMAAMPIYGKDRSNIFFAGTAKPIATKIEMKQLRLQYYNVCINHDHVMTLTDFTARVIYAENC